MATATAPTCSASARPTDTTSETSTHATAPYDVTVAHLTHLSPELGVALIDWCLEHHVIGPGSTVKSLKQQKLACMLRMAVQEPTTALALELGLDPQVDEALVAHAAKCERVRALLESSGVGTARDHMVGANRTSGVETVKKNKSALLSAIESVLALSRLAFVTGDYALSSDALVTLDSLWTLQNSAEYNLYIPSPATTTAVESALQIGKLMSGLVGALRGGAYKALEAPVLVHALGEADGNSIERAMRRTRFGTSPDEECKNIAWSISNMCTLVFLSKNVGVAVEPLLEYVLATTSHAAQHADASGEGDAKTATKTASDTVRTALQAHTGVRVEPARVVQTSCPHLLRYIVAATLIHERTLECGDDDDLRSDGDGSGASAGASADGENEADEDEQEAQRRLTMRNRQWSGFLRSDMVRGVQRIVVSTRDALFAGFGSVTVHDESCPFLDDPITRIFYMLFEKYDHSVHSMPVMKEVTDAIDADFFLCRHKKKLLAAIRSACFELSLKVYSVLRVEDVARMRCMRPDQVEAGLADMIRQGKEVWLIDAREGVAKKQTERADSSVETVFPTLRHALNNVVNCRELLEDGRKKR